ncbi:MAG TPA: YbaB/EbfC family nucleoid-associated protein [Thermoguttaceae bacterium]
MFKGIANLAALIRQAQQISSQMGQITEAMKNHHVTGSSGGGMVEIEVNGLMEILRCHIDQQLIEQGDRELLEDLVVAAVNQAIAKGKQMHAETMKELTGGIPLPASVQEALEKFTGTEQDEE